MATPSFIYSFDNLTPNQFADLCGRLLGARYKGFLLGGIGPDGGVDGEIDSMFAIWQPEEKDALLNRIIDPGQTIVFQFKHTVTARVGGQVKARQNLMNLFNCRKDYTCEIHRPLIAKKSPDTYVLITNIEVNSNFRSKFIDHCRKHNPEIGNYQIIGLDELESWITMDTELRHLYFPTIFGPPRFSLQIKLNHGIAVPSIGQDSYGKPVPFLYVEILNIGTVPSYVNSISFKSIIDGDIKYLHLINIDNELLREINPEPGTKLESGRKQVFSYPMRMLYYQFRNFGEDVFLSEVIVRDEIGNTYSAVIPEALGEMILSGE